MPDIAGVIRRGAESEDPSQIKPRAVSLVLPRLEEPLPLLPEAPEPVSNNIALPFSSVSRNLLDELRGSAKPSPLDPNTWARILSDADVPCRDVIVAALRDGVPLRLDDSPVPAVQVPNHPLLYYDLPRVRTAIAKEVTLGRYVKVPPKADTSSLNVSAMGVAPRFASSEARRTFEASTHQYRPYLKNASVDDFRGRPVLDGPGLTSLARNEQAPKWRIIHDLTHPEGQNVNARVSAPSFDLPTAVGFARKLTRGAFMWKGDIDSAFRIVPVLERDWPLLAFHVDGSTYVDTRLPFGHALSPFYFVNIVGRPTLYVSLRRGAALLGPMAAYIDDFFGGCSSHEKALQQLNIWRGVCSDLGIPISEAKTVLPAQTVEVLGYVIDTNEMTISVRPDRIQEILDEMALILGRKAVQRHELERLAGKMVFVCSVVPGGRTFMRELLDTLRRLEGKKHWAHLSSGFRADLAWWAAFAQRWNGIELIPPKVSVPWQWLTSDASGDEGLGLFCCGRAIHVPLPLSLVRSRATSESAESDLIIAETELVAAVLLVAMAAPMFPGKHLLVGIDNTTAISWIDRGTARRPRAMRALRVLWRIQALFRVHVSTRYIRSEHNTLADAASRLDHARLAAAAEPWLQSNLPSLRSAGIDCPGVELSHVAYGARGGPTGLLAELLVEGHDQLLRDTPRQMDDLLLSFRPPTHRPFPEQPDRLRDLPGDRRESGISDDLRDGESVSGLSRPSSLLYLARPSEPGQAPRSQAVPERSCQVIGQTRGEGGANDLEPPPRNLVGSPAGPDQRCCSDGSVPGPSGILGLPPPWRADSKTPREESAGAEAEQLAAVRLLSHCHDHGIQDDPIRRAGAPNRGPSPGRSALVPIESIQPLDLFAATSFFPDAIVRAVLDRQPDALSFALPRDRQSPFSSIPASVRPLVSPGLRCPGPIAGHPHQPDHATRRLEVVACRPDLRQRRAHPEPPWRRIPEAAGVRNE